MNENLLYKKDTYLNDNIPYLFNRTIYEYDMKSAGLNLSKAYKLLPDKTIEKLSKMKKERRSIELGNLQRSNPEFKEKLKQAFEEARRMFFELNEIEKDDVISIKKDAIFTTKYCKILDFLDSIEFRVKNEYSSYIRLNNRVEIYYSPYCMDIKGMNEEKINYHKDYMIKFLRLYFNKMETEDTPNVLKFLRRFIDQYKSKELEVGYYRRFDRNDPRFDTIEDHGCVYYEYWEENKDELDITFNYFEVLLKLVKIPL